MALNIKKIRSNKLKNKFVFRAGFIILLFSLILIGPVAKAEWLEPSTGPVIENFYAPITTTGEPQAKEGNLLLDPVNYHPTEDTSLNFSIPKPLVVMGAGIYNATPNIYNNSLLVDSDTLYVDGILGWAGIGSLIPNSNERLFIKGNANFGTEANPIIGQALSAYSADDFGIYGDAGSINPAAVYGLKTSSGGWAARGESSGLNVGVRGQSDSGAGIYASTYSPNYAAVYGENDSTGWAAYFDGKLGAVSDMVAAMFLPTNLSYSLLPFTAGHEIMDFQISDDNIGSVADFSLAFDGNNIWATAKQGEGYCKDSTCSDQISCEDSAQCNSHWLEYNTYKIRASDGQRLATYNIGGNQNRPTDLAFDGQYMWATSSGASDDSLVKVDIETGEKITNCSTLDSGAGQGATPNNLVISDIDGEIFIWTANYEGADITKFDRDCNQIGVYPLGTEGTGDLVNRLIGLEEVKPMDIIFADGYLWITTRVDSSELIQVNPNDGSVVNRYSINLEFPTKLLHDGMYLWIIGTPVLPAENKIIKVRAADGVEVENLVLSRSPIDLAFDGTYIWVATNGSDLPNTGMLVRISAATNIIKDYPASLSTNYWDGNLLFDSTYLWSLSGCDYGTNSCADGNDKPLRLKKIYSGTGFGHENLASVVDLRRDPGFCVNPADSTDSSHIQCFNNSHCPSYTGIFGTDGSGAVIWDRLSSDTKDAYGMAIDSNYMYVAGNTDTNNIQIEKRKLYNGRFCSTLECGTGFGTNNDGKIISDTTNSRVAYDIAIDSDYMYVVGSNDNTDFHIEKRYLTDGTLEGTNFGTGGIVTGASDSGSIKGVAVDTNYLYVVGQSNQVYTTASGFVTGYRWRIEKYNKTTGALCTGGACAADFGMGVCTGDANWKCESDAACSAQGLGTCNLANPTGIIQLDSASLENIAEDIVIDGTHMYVVGDNSEIQKRLLSTGGLVAAFDSDGIIDGVTGQPTALNIDLHNSSIYISYDNHYLQKRDSTTGALDVTFDDDGILQTADTFQTYALEVNDSAILLGGSGWTNDGWSIEKWNLNGTIDTNFGNNGVVDVSYGESDELYDFALDSNDQLYSVGNNYGGSIYAWRIEKRQTVGTTAGELGNITGAEVCNADFINQAGNINISNDAEITKGHCYANSEHLFDRSCTTDADCSDLVEATCVGGDIRVNDDVVISNNTWGGADVEINSVNGVATCPSGQFMKGVLIDSNNKISKIYCRKL